MNVQTVNELVELFEDKLENLQLAIKVRNISTVYRDDCENLILELLRDLSNLKNIFSQLRNEITRGQKNLQELKVLTERVSQQNKYVTYLRENLPKYLPKPEKEKISAEKHALTDINIKGIPKSGLSIPKIEYLNKQDFESIPRYLRGRLTYTMLNESINDFNQCVLKKYQLLNKPLGKIGQFEIKLHKIYKQQITKDTKGHYFCTRDDLRKFSNFKFDNSSKSILACLRHSKRIQELFTCGIICYAIA